MVVRTAGPVPSPFGMSMPVVSMMKKGLPPARSAISFACCSGIRPPPDCRTRLIDSEGDSRSRRSSTEFPLVDPQSGLSSRSSLRARATINARRGPRRPGVARRSTRSNIAGLRLCASSKSIITGWSRAKPSMIATKPALDLVGRVAGVDSGQVSYDRGRWRERRRVGVGAWLASQHDHRGPNTRCELVGEARFADAGLAENSQEHWSPGRGCEAEALIEDGLLAGTADEWDGSPRGSHRQPIDRESIETGIEALGFDMAATPVRDSGRRKGMGGAAGQELARARCRLQPRRQVDDRTGHQHLAAGVSPHGRLP